MGVEGRGLARDISIPTGPIESHFYMIFVVRAQEFQFLLVQLRVVRRLQSLIMYMVFQFLLVQLRVNGRSFPFKR